MHPVVEHRGPQTQHGSNRQPAYDSRREFAAQLGVSPHQQKGLRGQAAANELENSGIGREVQQPPIKRVVKIDRVRGELREVDKTRRLPGVARDKKSIEYEVTGRAKSRKRSQA